MNDCSLGKIKFPENNSIYYGQDFSQHIGVPSNVEFNIVQVHKNFIQLRADGYGNKGNYGNGCILIN